MNEARGQERDLPTASLADASARQTLSYSHQITGDMVWVLRFVGSFILCQGVLPLLSFLPDIGQMGRVVLSWRDSLGLFEVVLVALAGVGIFARKRIAIWAAMVLCLLQGFMYWVILPRGTFGLLWAATLPAALVKCTLLGLIWQRAERAGVLVPVRPERSLAPAEDDDVLWLIRRLGVYLLLPAVSWVLWAFSGLFGSQQTLWEFPVNTVTSIATASLSVLAGVGLILGWYRLLLFWACIALMAPIASRFAVQWDLAHNPQYSSGMPRSLALFGVIHDLAYGITMAGLYFILHRKARGRTGFQTVPIS